MLFSVPAGLVAAWLGLWLLSKPDPEHPAGFVAALNRAALNRAALVSLTFMVLFVP